MWNPDPDARPFSPFEEPIPDPGTDPGDAPQVCIGLNIAWRPILAGSFLTALAPSAWQVSDPAALADVQERAEQLLHRIGVAGPCPAANMLSVTIASGSASGEASASFTTPFAVAPVVVVSCDNPDLIASFASVTVSGFVAVLTANVVQPASLTANVSYIAMPAA